MKRAIYVLSLAFICLALNACGGGGRSQGSPNGTGTATITALSPSAAEAGSSALSVKVSGSSFAPTSVVHWNGQAKPTTYVSSRELRFTATATDLSSTGDAKVRVVTGVNRSAEVTFHVSPPAPVATAIAPASAPAGTPSVTLKVTGAKLTNTSVVRFNGSDVPTTFLSSNELMATVPQSALAASGLFPVAVFTPGASVSAALEFAVEAPVPVLNSISPNKVVQGSGDFTLTLTGANFISNSSVRINGQAYATAFQSNSNLSVQVPAAAISRPGNFDVTVFNPAPSGGLSAALPLTVRSNANHPPFANAGADQTVHVGANVQLDAANSTDADGDALTYQWVLTSVPAGSGAALSSQTSVNPTFTADRPGTYVAQLVVSDSKSNSAPAHVTISTLNSAPVANAGADKSVKVGTTVQLDGTKSSDVDGDALTYQWALTSKPANSTASLNAAKTARPSFVVDKPGTYVATLTVNDGSAESTPASVTVSTINSAPVANAGADQTVGVQSLVQLDASQSTDVDGDSITYAWSIVASPQGSSAQLSDPSSLNPTFTADRPGTYVAQLVVNDGKLDSAPVTVTITTTNSAPVADAGPDQTVALSATVQLDGSRSHDVDGNGLTYTWSLVSRPAQSSAVLSDSAAVRPSFVVDKRGTYVAQLIVSDGELSSVPATVTISTGNVAPVASAGANQSVYVQDVVHLDGSASSDVDGGALSYAWSLLSKPQGSTAALTNPTNVNPTFTVDLPGTYVAQLVVNDGIADSAPATVTITTLNSAPVADAGPSQSVVVGTKITLDGTGSSDADGDPLTFLWSVAARAAGSVAELSGSDTADPTFVVDKPGDYVFQLIVNDGYTNSSAATVTVSTVNSAPVAVAGQDQQVDVGTTVQLDGSASTDADGDPLAYSWSLLSKPNGSAAALNSVSSATASFVADAKGSYVAQLIVNDSKVNSAPATVMVTTINRAPTAAFAIPASATVGDVITLDGSTSSDPDGDVVAYQWSLVSQPAGSTATVVGASAAQATLTPDVPGDYSVRLIVSDGSLTSNPVEHTVAIAPAHAISISPAATNLTAGESATLTVSLSTAASAGGETITLSSDNAGLVTMPATVGISEGATSATITITAGNSAGTTTIRANANGWTEGTADISVALRTFAVQLESGAVSPGKSVAGKVSLASAAAAGGVTFTLSTTSSGVVTFAPSTITIGEGSFEGLFSVTGVAVGTTTLIASAPNYADISTEVTVTNNAVSLGSGSVSTSPGQSVSIPLNLTMAAPAGGITVKLSSADTSIATVTPSVFIAEGALTPASNPQVTGVNVGTTAITAVAAGFAPDTRSVTISLSLSLSPQNLEIVNGRTGTMTVNLSAPAPQAGVSLELSTDDTAVATVPATLNIPAGQTSAQITVTAVALGTTSVRAKGTGLSEVTSTVKVLPPPGIAIGNATVGKDLVGAISGMLQAWAPLGGVKVTITSSDPTKVLLSYSDVEPGVASLTFDIPSGAYQIGTFFVHGLQSSGDVQIKATAPGFGDGSGTVTLVPSGAYMYPSSFDTTMLQADTNIPVIVSRLDPTTLGTAGPMKLRPGADPIVVKLSSSNPAVGTVPASVTIAPGTDSAIAKFHPTGPGATTVSITGVSAGHSIASNLQQVQATVTVPVLNVGDVAVGKDLQTTLSVWPQTPAPAGGLNIVVTSSDPTKVLLSKDASTLGSASISFDLPGGAGWTPNFYVQALAANGTVQLTTTAAGYQTKTSTVTLQSSGFYLDYAAPTIETTTFSPDTVMVVTLARLNAAGAADAWQPLRAGVGPLSLAVTSSNPSVGTVTVSPVIVNANESRLLTGFHPTGAGSTTITLQNPAGFQAPANGSQQIKANVTAPGITVHNKTVGNNMQIGTSVDLQAGAPAGGVDLTITSSDPTKLLLSKDGLSMGSASITYHIPQGGISTGTFIVQAFDSAGTVTLTATAQGYNTSTGTVTLAPSGFRFNLGQYNTTTFSPNIAVEIIPVTLNPGTDQYAFNSQLRYGAGPFTIPIGSTNPGVGQMTASSVSIGSLETVVFAQFDPVGAGVTNLTITQPAGFIKPNSLTSIPATVTAPDLGGHTSYEVGKDLQVSGSVNLTVVPPNPVTITVTSSAPAVVTLSTDPAVAGGSSVAFADVTGTAGQVYYIQGRSVGSATLRVQAAGYNDLLINVSVGNSGFVIISPGQISTGVGSSDVPIEIGVGLLDTNNVLRTRQPVRGGLTVPVSIASSNTASGQLTVSPVTFNPGALSGATAFHAVAGGSSTITLQTPQGFTSPAVGRQIVATVQ